MWADRIPGIAVRNGGPTPAIAPVPPSQVPAPPHQRAGRVRLRRRWRRRSLQLACLHALDVVVAVVRGGVWHLAGCKSLPQVADGIVDAALGNITEVTFELA